MCEWAPVDVTVVDVCESMCVCVQGINRRTIWKVWFRHVLVHITVTCWHDNALICYCSRWCVTKDKTLSTQYFASNFDIVLLIRAHIFIIAQECFRMLEWLRRPPYFVIFVFNDSMHSLWLFIGAHRLYIYIYIYHCHMHPKPQQKHQ